MATWNLAAKARNDFADMMESLTPEQQGQPTLCDAWDAKGVLAHLVMFVELGAFGFFKQIATHRFDFDAAWIDGAADRHGRSTEDLVQTLRSKAAKSAPLPGFPEALSVADVAIHTQDVRRPLGAAGALDDEVLRTTLDFVTTSKQAKNLLGSLPPSDVRLVATDMDWSSGSGAEVHGTGEAILMALAHRPVFDELTGDGVDRLR